MSLPTARLGRTALEITPLGLGAWAIGGGGWAGGWGAQDDAESVRTIRHAVVDRGLNWIDTAAAYGFGHAEEVVGEAVSGLGEAERPLVFTKCGLLWDDSRSGYTNSLAPDSIRRECEDSLRRLRVDVIDLYQMHWPTWDETPVEESWAAMAELVEAGKVRAIGISNFSLDEIERCDAVRPVDTLQPELNLVNRGAAADRLPWADERGVGVIVYSPMASGLLTGRFSAERAASLPEDDWRRGHPNFSQPELSRNLALVEALAPIAERLGASLPELAVAWALAWPGVNGAIVGARHPDQVDGWIGASSVRLADTDMEAIADVLTATGAGAGPTGPTERVSG